MYNVLYTSSQNGEIKVYLSTAMIFFDAILCEFK